MNMVAVKNELLKLAKMIEAFKVNPNEKTRGEQRPDSDRSYSPTYAAHIRDMARDAAKKAGYQISPSGMKQEWSEYLTYVYQGADRSNNKYHYYAIYSFPADGNKLYVGCNCNGGIGEIQRWTDLTDKFAGGPVETLNEAMSCVNKHLRTKLDKGYKPTKMV